MALSTQYVRIDNIRVDLFFNRSEVDSESVTHYQPLIIRVAADVYTTEGAKRYVEARTTIGNLMDEPLTPNQIYTQFGLLTNLHNQIRNTMKQLYQNAIASDISA